MGIADIYARKALAVLDSENIEGELRVLFQEALSEAIDEAENEAMLDMQIALKFYAETINYHEGLKVDQYGGLAREVLKKWAGSSQSLSKIS